MQLGALGAPFQLDVGWSPIGNQICYILVLKFDICWQQPLTNFPKAF